MTSTSAPKKRSAAKPAAIDRRYLLTDDQVIDFIIKGYIAVTPECDPSLHARVCREFDANGVVPVDLQNDPTGEAIYTKSPTLKTVFTDPVVHGATVSLVGHDYFVFGRYCHNLGPKQGGAYWHQDDVNTRRYQVRRLMFLYYPQDVTPDMGPTYVVPGTHLFNTPTDRMATLGNVRGQVPLVCKAGTVFITSYDIWHTASFNSSNKMRYLVKYYVDRTHEPKKPTWNHNAKTATPLAMNRMHHENTYFWNHEHYKQRHLRWLIWSHLLGKGDKIEVWDKWPSYRPGSDKLTRKDFDGVQGYIGAPMV